MPGDVNKGQASSIVPEHFNSLKCLSLNYFTLPNVTGSKPYTLCQAINKTYILTGTATDSRYKCDRCNRNIRSSMTGRIFGQAQHLNYNV
jgi:hypothetical protein